MDGNRHERGNVAHDVSMQLSEGTVVDLAAASGPLSRSQV